MVDWSDAIRVHPWVGEKFGLNGLFPFRTLILGESNYTTAEKFGTGLVQSCVNSSRGSNDEKNPNFCRFATKIRKTALGRKTAVSAKEFWDNLAFYNFIQERVGENSRDRPTKADWENSQKPFSEVIAQLRVERVLVLGKENWENFKTAFNCEIIDEVFWFEIASMRVRAAHTAHPSGFGYRYEDWEKSTRDFLGVL